MATGDQATTYDTTTQHNTHARPNRHCHNPGTTSSCRRSHACPRPTIRPDATGDHPAHHHWPDLTTAVTNLVAAAPAPDPDTAARLARLLRMRVTVTNLPLP